MSHIMTKHEITGETPPRLLAFIDWTEEKKEECARRNYDGLEALHYALELIDELSLETCEGISSEIEELKDGLSRYCLLIDKPQQLIQSIITHLLLRDEEPNLLGREGALKFLSNALIMSLVTDEMITPGSSLQEPAELPIDPNLELSEPLGRDDGFY